ncbi:MAG: hypothetical protein WBZ36_26355, partial [Candidatus Nitrosopolaris sp.]
ENPLSNYSNIVLGIHNMGLIESIVQITSFGDCICLPSPYLGMARECEHVGMIGLTSAAIGPAGRCEDKTLPTGLVKALVIYCYVATWLAGGLRHRSLYNKRHPKIMYWRSNTSRN